MPVHNAVITSKWCVMLPVMSLKVNPVVVMLWSRNKGNITNVLCSLETITHHLLGTTECCFENCKFCYFKYAIILTVHCLLLTWDLYLKKVVKQPKY